MITPTTQLLRRLVAIAALINLLWACSPEVSVISEQELLNRAQLLLDQGESKGAVIEFKNVLVKNPANLEARWELGKIYLAGGDYPSAIKELERASSLGIERQAVLLPLTQAFLGMRDYQRVLFEITPQDIIDSPGDADKLLNLKGESLRELGEYDAAIKAFSAALEKSPDSHTAMVGRTQAAIQQGDADSSKQYLQNLLRAYPDSAPALILKGRLASLNQQSDASLTAFEQALAADPNNQNALTELSRALLAQGKHQQAAPHIAELLKRPPITAEKRYLRAWQLYQMKRFPPTKQLLETALRIDKNYSQARLLLAASNFALGENEMALANLKRLPRSPEYNSIVRQLRAAIQLKMGDSDMAIETLAPDLENTGTSNALVLTLASLAKIDQGELSEARALGAEAQRAARRDFEKKLTRQTQRAQQNLRAGNLNEAVRLLKKVVLQSENPLPPAQLLFDIYIKDRNFVSAKSLAEYLQKGNPQSSDPLIMLGSVELFTRNPEAARAAFQHAIDIDPESLPAQLNLLALQRASGDIAAASAGYQALLEAHPNDIRIFKELYRTDLTLGNREQAHHWLEMARDANPSSWRPYRELSALALLNDDRAGALNVLRQAVSRLPDSVAAAQALAQLQAESGQGPAAIATARALLARTSNSPAAQALMADTLAGQGQLKAAETAYRAAFDSSPDNGRAAAGLFRLQLANDDPEAALATARALAAVDGNASLALAMAGEAFVHLGKTENAVHSFRESLRKSPNSRNTAYKLHRALLMNGNKQEAESTLTSWLDGHPKDSDGRTLLAKFYATQGKPAAARRALEAILQYDPESASTLNDLAGLYAQSDPAHALELANSAHALLPKNANIMDTLGWLLVEQKSDPQRALELLRAASSGAAENQAIRYHLATALAAAGMKQQASKQLALTLANPAVFRQRPDAEALASRLANAENPSE